MLTLAISHDSQFQSASVDSPLYILPHSKTMLTLAISHDSQFLLFQQVFDSISISYLYFSSVESASYIILSF